MGEFVHASFDETDDFIPRVPEWRLGNEDAGRPRICVTPDLRHSLSAIPGILRITSGLESIEYNPVIHAYTLEIPDDSVMTPYEIRESVPDSFYTQEYWITEKPVRVKRQDYRWICPGVRLSTSIEGYSVPFVTGTFKLLPATDGIMDFVRFVKADEGARDELYALIRKTGLRTVLSSIDRPLSFAIQNNRDRYKRMDKERI